MTLASATRIINEVKGVNRASKPPGGELGPGPQRSKQLVLTN
jgi:hypothetical protein